MVCKYNKVRQNARLAHEFMANDFIAHLLEALCGAKLVAEKL